MDELGLFPLNLVLLPGEQAPLHIFEPRYRELIGECLEDGKEFGLVLADDDGMRDVGTRAEAGVTLEAEGGPRRPPRRCPVEKRPTATEARRDRCRSRAR